MSLAQALIEEFPPDVRSRGQEYFRDRRVRLVVSRDALLMAEVDGEETYKVYLTPDGCGEYGAFCSCLSFRRFASCKHLWATLLEADSRRLPWALEARAGYLAVLELEEVLEEKAAPVRRNGTAVAAWRSQLSQVQSMMQEALAGRAPLEDLQLIYVLDVDAAREDGVPVLNLHCRRRRANGEWGTLRPFRRPIAELAALPDARDRQLLAALHGATPDGDKYLYGLTTSEEVSDSYRLDAANAGLLVPLLCGTGRFFLRRGEQLEPDPLTWDAGDPWVLGLEVHQGEDQGWEMRGFLRRGDERMDLAEPELLLMYGQLFVDGRAASFDARSAFAWVNLLREQEVVQAPKDELEALVEEILNLPAQPLLELPEPWSFQAPPVPKPWLEAEPADGSGGVGRRIGCRLSFDYGGARVAAGVPRQILRRPGKQILCSRDAEAEQRALDRLQELGARPTSTDGYTALFSSSRFPELVRTLLAEGWEVRAEGKAYRAAGSFQLSVSSGVDWFDLHGEVRFGNQSVGLPELLRAARQEKDQVRLGDGSVGLLPEDWLRRCGLLAAFGDVRAGEVRFSPSQAFLLDALLAEVELDLDARFIEARRRLRDFSGVEPRQEPEEFVGTLREYQRQALGWFQFLRDFSLGGCLADDMGLGKTVQVLALLEERRADGAREDLPSLVVVPRSLVFNWMHEARRFAPRLRVVNYTGVQREAVAEEIPRSHLVVTTYGVLRRDILALKEQPFDYAVLDEAQAIKNASSQAAKAVRLLKARHRLALSGTPIENHLGELWSLFEFLNPGMLGRSSSFRKLLATGSRPAEDQRELLARAVRPLILRRTKEQVVKELPPKIEQTLYCAMDSNQRHLYDELRAHYRASLLSRVERDGIGRSRMHVLEALLRLRQAACHPGLIDEDRREEVSAKLEILLPQLLEVCNQGHRALVFSQFTSLLSIVRQRLEKEELGYEYLDGQTRDRQRRVERFQSGDGPPVFLISLKAGGVGLNLTAADYVFILDPWWNPAAESQAIDRAHRIGQHRRVFAYRLICRDTVEEKIVELQRQKRDLADAIIQSDGGGVLQSLSAADLELLLS